MLVRFTQSIAGAGWVYNTGDLADIPEDEAFRLVNANVATPEPEPTPIETATPAAALETATIKTTSRKAK